MTRPRPWSWSGPEVNATVWRGRAVRYLLIYLALLLSLVAVRYLTREIRPAMLGATALEGQLITQRNTLSLEVQSLENLQRVRDWAFAHGMRRFAEAVKEIRPIPPARAPAAVSPLSPRRVEVKTQWK